MVITFMEIEEIFLKYINSRVISVKTLGDGHINDTFLVESGAGKYIVQRVKSSMDIDGCLFNFGLYSRVMSDTDWKYPVLIGNNEGKIFYTDENDSHWRVYEYIDGEILNAPIDEKVLYSCGRGLAKMHMLLGGITERPKALYPHLHDLKYYYDLYLQVRRSSEIRRENRDPYIEERIDSGVNAMLAVDPDRTSVVHGDPKLANILFRGDEVIGFIDFDTVMSGSRLEDLADCVRSCCIEDGVFNKTKAQSLISGYTDNIPHDMLSGMDSFPAIYNKICFELGLRYYIDALSNGKTFKEKYPGYLLERAKSLFSDKIKYN